MVLVAAPSACLSALFSATGVGSPAGGSSVTGLPGHSMESPRSEQRCRRLSSGERSQSSMRRVGGESPSPASSFRLARSSASSGAVDREAAMPPPPAGRL